MENGELTVRGPKGELRTGMLQAVKAEISDKAIVLTVNDPGSGKEKALWGLYRSLAQNMVTGVNTGFQKKLELNGVGYRVSQSGAKLVFNIGFSHQVNFPLPAGITALVEGNQITLSGIDKQLVGETAAQIRRLKPPEPYKGKGIKYADEVIRRKAGKTASKGSK